MCPKAAGSVWHDPSSTSAADVAALRAAAFGDERIFAMTTWIALRVAFLAVNDGG